jgi:hypothetical protein
MLLLLEQHDTGACRSGTEASDAPGGSSTDHHDVCPVGNCHLGHDNARTRSRLPPSCSTPGLLALPWPRASGHPPAALTGAKSVGTT